jgi:hypothetical protein
MSGKNPRTGRRRSHPPTFNGIDFLYRHVVNNQIEKHKNKRQRGMPNGK